MEVHANRTKRQCSKSMTSMYSKEFRFSYTLKTTLFLHFSSFYSIFKLRIILWVFWKEVLRPDNLSFQEKNSITQPYDKASPFQCCKDSLYFPMYQNVFLFHSLVTDLWCTLSADESLMALMEQSFTASSLQGLLYHSEQRAKVCLSSWQGGHLRVL